MTVLEKYIIARWCYAIGEDYMDDIEYRQVEDSVKDCYPNSEYLHRSWSDDPCPLELLEKFNMMHLYRDIKFHHQSESIRSINSDSEFETQFKNLNKPSRLSYKLDGWNIQVNYYNGKPISAETRGRTGNSLNANIVTSIVPQNIPVKGKVKITGELVIPNAKWSLFKLETGNVSQRNSVSTALAKEMTEFLEFVSFSVQTEDVTLTEDAYDILVKWGFNTPRKITVNNFLQLNKAMEILGQLNETYKYPNDGLVIENEDYQLAIRVGTWKEEIMCSYVTSYEENHGAYGVAMVVNIKPVVYNGTTRRQVSVTNLQYILNADLRIGSPIAFDNRSMVTAVLNTTETAELHKEWAGNFEGFRKMIDEREVKE